MSVMALLHSNKEMKNNYASRFTTDRIIRYVFHIITILTIYSILAASGLTPALRSRCFCSIPCFSSLLYSTTVPTKSRSLLSRLFLYNVSCRVGSVKNDLFDLRYFGLDSFSDTALPFNNTGRYVMIRVNLSIILDICSLLSSILEKLPAGIQFNDIS